MTNQVFDFTLRKAAFVAGISILIMTIAAVFATDITIGNLVDQGDAATTFNNIKSNELVFRAGIFSWLIILICDVLVAWGLYIFLKPVNKSVSLIMAWFRLIYIAILGTAILNYIEILTLISNDSSISGFSIQQVQLLVMQSVNGFQDMWSLGLVVFGIHIYFLGYLIIKSNYIPKLLGIILVIAFVGYVLTNVLDLFLPGYEQLKTIIEWIFIIPILSEVYLGLWLLVKGVKIN